MATFIFGVLIYILMLVASLAMAAVLMYFGYRLLTLPSDIRRKRELELDRKLYALISKRGSVKAARFWGDGTVTIHTNDGQSIKYDTYREAYEAHA